MDRQGAADDEASSRGATEPRRRRGVAPTARQRWLDRRRSAGIGAGAPVVLLAGLCLAGSQDKSASAPHAGVETVEKP